MVHYNCNVKFNFKFRQISTDQFTPYSMRSQGRIQGGQEADAPLSKFFYISYNYFYLIQHENTIN